MSPSEFIRKICSLEKSMNIDEIRYSDFNAWPLVRLAILRRASPKPSPSRAKSTWDLGKKIRRLLRSGLANLGNPMRVEQVDIVYFTLASQSREVVNNQRSNPHAEGLREFFAKNHRVKTLEMSDDYQGPKACANNETTSLDSIFLRTLIRFKLSNLFRFDKYELFTPMNKEIQRIFGFQIRVDSDVEFLNLLAEEFVKVLWLYNPKVVFVSVFYRIEAMAMCLACERLGIKVVEYQHGAQSDQHPMYTNWENAPKSGYELIPDIFWTWGEASKRRISTWADKTKKHSAILGGNLWMTLNGPIHTEALGARGEGYYKDGKIHVLVSLQGDPFFPGFLLDAIFESSNFVVWHLRDHPRLPITKSLRRSILQCENTELEESTSTALYELLSRVDIHVTGFSTVAFEAQVFNVPTVFTHVNAVLGHSSLIGLNGLNYADSAAELLKLVKRLNDSRPLAESVYIISDLELSTAVLDALVHNSNPPEMGY
jgi:hypothetical protein